MTSNKPFNNNPLGDIEDMTDTSVAALANSTEVKTEGVVVEEVADTLEQRFTKLNKKLEEKDAKNTGKPVTIILTNENAKELAKFKSKGAKSELVNEVLKAFFEIKNRENQQK